MLTLYLRGERANTIHNHIKMVQICGQWRPESWKHADACLTVCSREIPWMFRLIRETKLSTFNFRGSRPSLNPILHNQI